MNQGWVKILASMLAVLRNFSTTSGGTGGVGVGGCGVILEGSLSALAITASLLAPRCMPRLAKACSSCLRGSVIYTASFASSRLTASSSSISGCASR
jgi:hypothetical protein